MNGSKTSIIWKNSVEYNFDNANEYTKYLHHFQIHEHRIQIAKFLCRRSATKQQNRQRIGANPKSLSAHCAS